MKNKLVFLQVRKNGVEKQYVDACTMGDFISAAAYKEDEISYELERQYKEKVVSKINLARLTGDYPRGVL